VSIIESVRQKCGGMGLELRICSILDRRFLKGFGAEATIVFRRVNDLGSAQGRGRRTWPAA